MGSEPRVRALSYTVELEELLATAQRTALESTHATVAIEHLLLAFVDADQASRLLQLDAAGLQTLRAQLVARLMQQTDEPTSYGRLPPHDGALTAVLDAAEGRARAIGLAEVDAPSVVGSLVETSSPVADWLRDLGVTVTPPPSASPSARAQASSTSAEKTDAALEAPWPPALGGAEAPPLAPAETRSGREDDDAVDQPTDESTFVGDPAPGAFTSDRPTDLEDDAAPTPNDKKQATPAAPPAPAPTSEAAAPAADRSEEGQVHPSLEPSPWNPNEFDDDIPTVHAAIGDGTENDQTGFDEEPTRYEDLGQRHSRDYSLVDEAFDDDLDEDEPSSNVPRRRDGGGETEFGVPPVPPPMSHGISDGQLVENIPRRMRVDRPETIQVRLSGKDGSTLRKGMHGIVSAHAIKVTRAMSARLVAPDGGFSIEPGTPETQWVDDPDGIREAPTEWTWTITPTRPGKRRLQLVVGARTVRDGVVAEAALPLQVIEVEVSANHGRIALQVAQWVVATLIGGVFGVFSEEILKGLQGVLGPSP